jgi:hypothetical protein
VRVDDRGTELDFPFQLAEFWGVVDELDAKSAIGWQNKATALDADVHPPVRVAGSDVSRLARAWLPPTGRFWC